MRPLSTIAGALEPAQPVRRWRGVPRAFALLFALAALPAACGYSTGIRASERIGSLGVAVFGNATLERDLERPLQDEITRALRSYTDVPLRHPDQAEVVMRGTVTEYHRRGGIRNPDNQLLETGVFIAAEATLFDRRTNRALGPPKQAGIWVGFVIDDPRNEPQARARALRNIAEELVLELLTPLE